MMDVSDIGGYHAHVYYDAETIDAARVLCEGAVEKFGVMMGRMHEKSAHIRCGAASFCFPAEQFADVVPWLNVNRGELIVFVHPLTGDDLYDHRDAPMWLGHSVPLKLEMFLKDGAT